MSCDGGHGASARREKSVGAGSVFGVDAQEGGKVPLAIAGTGYGIIGILVIILLVVLILYFVRRA